MRATLPSAALIGAFALWYAALLPVGAISHFDEFYTLDRSTAFARFGDWLNVYSENAVSFRKPPLQYWLTAILLELNVPELVALRAPSFVFALSGLAAIGLLAHAVSPATPLAAPVAILFAASSQAYWRLGVSALLDAGATLSVALALAAAIRALDRPRWWYVAALAIGFGALQKAPVALAVTVAFLAGLWLTSRWHRYRLGAIARAREFQVATLLALLLSSSWILLQFGQHGWVAITELVGEQMVDRFAPSASPLEERGFVDVLLHMTDDERKLVRGLGLIAVLALPAVLRRPELLPLPMILVGYGVAVGMAGGHISWRYASLLVPLYAAALAAAVLHPRVPRPLQAGLVLAIVVGNAGPFLPGAKIGLFPSDNSVDRVEILTRFGARSRDGEALVFCWWDRPRLPPGAIAVYASNDRPFHLVADPDALATDNRFMGPETRLRGICKEHQMPRIVAAYPLAEIVDTQGELVHWQAAPAE